MKWFTIPKEHSHFVFHYINAWESQNVKGETVIYVYACLHNDFDITFRFMTEHPFDRNKYQSDLTKLTFNLDTDETKVTTLLKNMRCEFPTINLDYKGYKNRYTYLSCYTKDLPET